MTCSSGAAWTIPAMFTMCAQRTRFRSIRERHACYDGLAAAYDYYCLNRKGQDRKEEKSLFEAVAVIFPVQGPRLT
jgi:hypothetical protein